MLPGIIVDTFQFTDPFQTLALNPSEIDRFLQSIRDVVAQRVPVEKLLRSRSHSGRRAQAKVSVETRIEFDNESSTHSTLAAGSRAGYHWACCAKSPGASPNADAISRSHSSIPKARWRSMSFI